MAKAQRLLFSALLIAAFQLIWFATTRTFGMSPNVHRTCCQRPLTSQTLRMLVQVTMSRLCLSASYVPRAKSPTGANDTVRESQSLRSWGNRPESQSHLPLPSPLANVEHTEQQSLVRMLQMPVAVERQSLCPMSWDRGARCRKAQEVALEPRLCYAARNLECLLPSSFGFKGADNRS